MTKRRIEIIRYRRTTIVRSAVNELPDQSIEECIDVALAEREETRSVPLNITPNPKQVPLRTPSKSGALFKRLFRR
jgi:hypothetical protein